MADRSAPPPEARGYELLSRISNELVRLQKEHYGRGPVSAKSYMLDDLLVTVMRGGMTPAERTLLDFDRGDAVRAFRQQWQNVMAGQLIGKVEELTGRTVATYQSQVMFDPDTIVEMFVFDEPAPDVAVHATAADQLADEPG